MLQFFEVPPGGSVVSCLFLLFFLHFVFAALAGSHFFRISCAFFFGGHFFGDLFCFFFAFFVLFFFRIVFFLFFLFFLFGGGIFCIFFCSSKSCHGVTPLR